MPDGPAHYAFAEEELSIADNELRGDPREEMCLKRAHIHAMLAVAASNIDAHLRAPQVVRRWNEAMGVHTE